MLFLRTRAINQVSCETLHPLRDGRNTLRCSRPSRHAIASIPSHATGTRPAKVAILGIHRRPSCGSSQLPAMPLHGPSAGLTPTLAIGISGPSCASRRLFRRHHLCHHQLPCGKLLAASPGFFQRSPLRRLPIEESTPAIDIAAACFGKKRTTASSVFRLRGSSPP